MRTFSFAQVFPQNFLLMKLKFVESISLDMRLRGHIIELKNCLLQTVEDKNTSFKEK